MSKQEIDAATHGKKTFLTRSTDEMSLLEAGSSSVVIMASNPRWSNLPSFFSPPVLCIFTRPSLPIFWNLLVEFFQDFCGRVLATGLCVPFSIIFQLLWTDLGYWTLRPIFHYFSRPLWTDLGYWTLCSIFHYFSTTSVDGSRLLDFAFHFTLFFLRWRQRGCWPWSVWLFSLREDVMPWIVITPARKRRGCWAFQWIIRRMSRTRCTPATTALAGSTTPRECSRCTRWRSSLWISWAAISRKISPMVCLFLLLFPFCFRVIRKQNSEWRFYLFPLFCTVFSPEFLSVQDWSFSFFHSVVFPSRSEVSSRLLIKFEKLIFWNFFKRFEGLMEFVDRIFFSKIFLKFFLGFLIFFWFFSSVCGIFFHLTSLIGKRGFFIIALSLTYVLNTLKVELK